MFETQLEILSFCQGSFKNKLNIKKNLLLPSFIVIFYLTLYILFYFFNVLDWNNLFSIIIQCYSNNIDVNMLTKLTL